MSYDGLIERKAIMERVENLAGGRVMKGVADDETHRRFLDGSVKPYICMLFSTPFPVDAGRTMTAGDVDTPHVVTVTAVAYAGDPDTAEITGAALRRRLVDFQPTPTSTTLKGEGGYDSNNGDGKRKPTRWDDGSSFSYLINMGPDA